MRFSRTELIIGNDGIRCLAAAVVGVFGLGGVGSAAAEALARSGIGRIILVDHDHVSRTDINRQIIALESTLGRSKVDVMQNRIKDINPDCDVIGFQEYFKADNADKFFTHRFDYVVDAIDTLPAKIDLIERCHHEGIHIVSAMGAGNKLDPTKLTVADISQTHTCPLARIVRLELRKRQIENGITTVFSSEQPTYSKTIESDNFTSRRRYIPGSTAFVPPVSGYIMAGVVVRDILDNKR